MMRPQPLSVSRTLAARGRYLYSLSVTTTAATQLWEAPRPDSMAGSAAPRPSSFSRGCHSSLPSGRERSAHPITSQLTPHFQRRPLHSSVEAVDFASPEREVLLTLSTEAASSASAPGIATLILNRPKSANALGRTMLTQLRQTLTALEPGGDLSSSVRVLILTSSHPKVFSAGADLRERAKMTQEEAREFVTELRETFGRVGRLPMPVIAAVEGAALGGGLELALTADLIIAGSGAKFGLPETSLAIIPGAGGTVRLPRKIGTARAKELIFTARRIGTNEALDLGLVEYAVEGGEAEEKAMEIAGEIAKNGPLALRAAKRSLSEGMNKSSIAEAMDVERECYGTIIDTDDRLEGLAAFREGRAPEYQGR